VRSVSWFLVLGASAVACSSSSGDSGSCIEAPEVLVAASDYASSVVCGAPCCVGTTGADLGGDPVLSASNGRAFYVARDFDTIFELDPRSGKPLTSSAKLHDLAPAKGGPANPHDVAAAPDGTLVVPLYNSARLAFMKDGVVVDSIPLSSYDADGNPQADAVSIITEDGGAPKAFVTLERLDDKNALVSAQTSQMLRVDVTTRTVEATIDLAGRNPFNPMAQLDGALFLAEPGNFDTVDDALAGIERFDTTTSTTRLLVHERDLGASVAEVAVTTGCGVAIVAGPVTGVNPTSVVTFDPTTGQIFASLAAPLFGPTAGYDLQGLAWRGNTLFVGDRRRAADGTWPIHVFERTTGCNLTLSTRTIPLPQRPVALRPTP